MSTLGAIPPNEKDILKRDGTYKPGRKPNFSVGLADGLHALREAQKAGLPELEFNGQEQSGTSIFDPVLCELAYRWFCTPGGRILDPFAGGSVRGIVAAYLGYQYIGIDLSARQLVANEQQATDILVDGQPRPKWVVGDSQELSVLLEKEVGECPKIDLVFSCPPYGDLEVYSEDKRDLSTKDHDAFIGAYRNIINQAVAMLRGNRFACFVVGDFRDGKGFYRNFVAETIAAFQTAGVVLYNEIILVTAVGSLPIRVGRQFAAG